MSFTFVNPVIQKFFYCLLDNIVPLSLYTFSANLIAENEQTVLLYTGTDEITTGAINNSKNVDASPTWQL